MQVYTKLSDYRVPHHDRWWNRYAPSSRQGLKTFAKQSRDIDDALSDDDYYLSLLPKDIRSHIYEYLKPSLRVEDSDNDPTSIVMDMGEHSMKLGFAGEDQPIEIVPSIIGKPRQSTNKTQHPSTKDSYVGSAAQEHRGILDITYPLHRGNLIDSDALHDLWHYAFHTELGIDPEEHPVLTTKQPLSSKSLRERYQQILFEDFQVPCIFIENSPVLELYASGNCWGTVISCGEGTSTVMSIADGYAVEQSIKRIMIGGKDVSEYLRELCLQQSETLGRSRESLSQLWLWSDMKEKISQVFPEYPGFSGIESVNYTLPDGTVLSVKEERAMCLEPYFTANLGFPFHEKTLPELAFESLMSCPIDIRKDLAYYTIAGGTSRAKGFKERFRSELQKLTKTKVHISSAPFDEMTWVGGSILASLTNFQQMWTSKFEYDESGPNYMYHRRRPW